MKIALYRHAQSTFNAHGDLSPNVPLTDYGKYQAGRVEGQYDLIVCSTLRRARETLDFSNIKYKRVIFTDLCREYLDGNTSNIYNMEDNYIETRQDLNNRVDKFIEFILQQPESLKEGITVAVVSHGCFLVKLTEKMGNIHYFSNCEQHDITIMKI